MSSKKRNLLIVVLLILTNVLTFSLTNLVTLKTNNRVVMARKDYEDMAQVYEEKQKANMLKDYIKENYLREVDDKTLKNGEYSGIFASLNDPYSAYMTEEEFEDQQQTIAGEYGGIGVVVSPGEDGYITVVSPIAGTPGEKAGIKTGDKILKVDGQEFKAEKMDDAVSKMKGKANSKVVLSILRTTNSKDEFLDIELVRENIKVETVKTEIVDNIGYINISSFYENTGKDLKLALKDLESKKVDGIVLDLRNNPGGLLDVCVEIADEFLDEGTVVYTETRSGKKEYEKSKKGKTDLPMTVVVNGGSASASEILAGALQDRKRATIVGETTFGKGVVQLTRRLKDGTGFKLTESEYFTPNGNSVDGNGIKPDVEVKIPEGVKYIGIENLKEDTQLQKAFEIVKGKK